MTTCTASWTNHLNVPPPPAAPPPPPPAAPPPPPSYTPPVVPPPAPSYVPPPPRKKMNWLWWLLGCGCLLIILVIAGAIWGGSKLWKQTVAPELQKQQLPRPPAPTTDDVAQPTTIDEPVKVPSAPAVTAKPGKQAALKAALKAAQGNRWVAKVNYASSDWQRAKVWIGPPASEFTTEVVLQWNPKQNAYIIEDTEGIEAEQPAKPQAKQPQTPAPKTSPRKPTVASTSQTATSAGAQANEAPVNRQPVNPPATSGPKPSRARAMAKCLAQAPGSGWVAKASNDSGDWTQCTVMIGPPASEFVTQFTLEWIPDKHNYAIRGRQSIGN
ncbi:MAG: hypothetical protein ACM3VW_01835 [Bacteroidota bacterium]